MFSNFMWNGAVSNHMTKQSIIKTQPMTRYHVVKRHVIIIRPQLLHCTLILKPFDLQTYMSMSNIFGSPIKSIISFYLFPLFFKHILASYLLFIAYVDIMFKLVRILQESLNSTYSNWPWKLTPSCGWKCGKFTDTLSLSSDYFLRSPKAFLDFTSFLILFI